MGFKKTSNEVLVSTSDGIEKVRTVKRIAKRIDGGKKM